jgi:hypothetical protein
MSSVVARLIVRRETLEYWIRESLSHLINITGAKKTLVVKSRDIEKYLGICDQQVKIRFGLVLRLLSEIGLAERLSNRKPRLYALRPRSAWRAFIETCKHDRFRCVFRKDSCQLMGACPYWRLINHIEAASLRGEIHA